MPRTKERPEDRLLQELAADAKIFETVARILLAYKRDSAPLLYQRIAQIKNVLAEYKHSKEGRV